MKSARFIDLEEALFMWILQERNKKHTITPDVVKTKAEVLFSMLKEKRKYSNEVTFAATNGWYDRFRKRYGLRMLTVSGEKASGDIEAFTSFKSNFLQVILENGYEKHEIYNADESGLFFKLLPSRTLTLHDEDIAEGRKVIKSRVTFMPCSNIDGSNKLPLMLLGTAQNPRTLPKDKSSLPVYYRSSKKAWMNRILFREWFYDQFVPSVKAFAQKHNRAPRALLLLDNCSAHHDGGDILECDDIKVAYLPPNVTSLGQPMDQGVLNAIKKRFKKKLMLRLLLSDEDLSIEEKLKGISLREVICWLHQSWEEISGKTIEGSWKNLIDEYPYFTLENEVKQWLNDSVYDMNSNILTGDCDLYTDQEIVDYVPNRQENSSLEFDTSNEFDQSNTIPNDAIRIVRFDEGRDKHDKAMECVEYLIDFLEDEGDTLEVIKLHNVKSKLIELEWKRRRES
ncbi:jerky protein homolog-like [Armigeres subalbatus]|uniref:jerky protein homolog-like n=1 Tax=Armigeres subalbatus TaxID=124917 RepID=UPI002ED4DB61